MRHTAIHKPSIRFRRWSRKSYATFVSIGRCVTIGTLGKNVVEKSLCKQKGSTRDMIWSVAEVLAEISSYWELKAGDLVFTGSPSGVSTLHRGDIVRAGCNGIGMIEFELV